MSVIVTDNGFGTDDWQGGFAALDCPAGNAPCAGVDMGPEADPNCLVPHLGAIPLIRVDFPSFTDGRGFTLAKRLRAMGYTGRLRAKGQVIADQYAMARRCGFDEVEIDEELAARQPQDQWQYRADWREHNYQTRLRG